MRAATMMLAFLIASVDLTSWAEEAGAKRVVVADFVTIAPKLEKYRPKMWEAIGDAVRESNWTMIRASRNVCSAKECPKDFADRDQAKAVVTIDGSYTNARFNVTLKLWGTQGWAGEFSSTSELCTAAEFAAAVGDSVRKALVAEEERILSSTDNEPKPLPVAKIVPTKPVPAVVESPKEVPPLPPPSKIGWAPWVIMGVGVALTTTGVWLWAKDGSKTNCSNGVCSETFKTSTAGIATTGLGGVTILTGIGWYLFSLRNEASVALGPGTISLSGRF